MSYCIVYLASPLDGYNSLLSTGEKRIDMMMMSLKNITTHLPLPVIMFHEDFTDDIMEKMKNIYKNISFEKIDFVNNNLPFKQKPCKTSHIANGICTCPRNKGTNRCCYRPKGYLMMCRFFSGQLQQHPALQSYDGYIRLDDDSFFIPPFLPTDTFMKQITQYDYAIRSCFREGQDQSSLFGFTKNFCKENNLPFLRIEQDLKKRGILYMNGQYTGIAPYNNFHFSKMSIWKHPIIKKYVDEIDKQHGCLVHNWMDANIHAMIMFILVPLIGLSANAVTNWGYRHNRHFSVLHRLGLHYKEGRFFPLIDIPSTD